MYVARKEHVCITLMASEFMFVEKIFSLGGLEDGDMLIIFLNFVLEAYVFFGNLGILNRTRLFFSVHFDH